MSQACRVTLKCDVSWWVQWYISAVAMAAHITGREPDLDKVAATAMNGVRIRVLPE